MQQNDVTWRKSTRSAAAGHCVEVGVEIGVAAGRPVRLRDSKDPGGPVLSFEAPGWLAFLAGVRLGEFDRPL